MASKSSKSAAIVIACAVAAVMFFIVIIVVCVALPDDEMYEIKEVDPYMTIKSMDADIVWKDDRSCKVKQKLSVRFHADSYGDFDLTRGIYIDIPVNNGERVRNLSVDTNPSRSVYLSHEESRNIVRARVGDENMYFYPGDTLVCTVSYDYITPEHKNGKDILAFMAIGEGWTCPIERATVTVTYPKAPDLSASDYEYGVWVAGNKSSAGKWSNDGKTLTVSVEGLGAYHGVEIAYKLPDGTLKDYGGTESLSVILIGVALFAAALVLQIFVAKNKPLTPIVDYYPPRVKGESDDYFDAPKKKRLEIRRMLPVQMGKIIDDRCSSTDVTSLIFYWASHGFLSIEDRDGDTYLIKEYELDSITDYEAKLFNKLFAKAKKNADGKCEVSVKKLSGSFANNITECKTAVNEEYKGKFYKSGFTALSYSMTALSALFGVLVAVLSTLRISGGMFNFFGFVAIIPAALSAVIGTILAKHYYKLGKNKRIALVVGFTVLSLALSFAVSLVIPLDATSWPERLLFAATLGGASALSPFLTVRRDEYNEQLNSILGFRDFLRDAEKDRLEAMLADDPQYYYNILPYANVLGVSDIWADKFKDMTLEPPTYYHSSSGPTLFDIYIITRLARSVGSSLTYVPPKVNVGSFSSHGGGHRGGGGFSGGSFGGGGGGRW